MLEEILATMKALVLPPGKGTLAEKRRRTRVEVDLPVLYRTDSTRDQLAEERKSAEKGRLIDLGLNNVRLSGFKVIPRGQRVWIVYPAAPSGVLDTVRFKAMWSRKGTRSFAIHTGLEFDDVEEHLEKTWLRHVLRRLGFVEDGIFQKREKVRAAAPELEGMVVLPDGHEPEPVTVLNLGVGGAFLNGPRPVPPMTDLVLQVGPWDGLPALRMKGRVCRYQPTGVLHTWGVEFTDPKPAQVSLLGKYMVRLLNKH